jgi:hypothetical protein
VLRQAPQATDSSSRRQWMKATCRCSAKTLKTDNVSKPIPSTDASFQPQELKYFVSPWVHETMVERDIIGSCACRPVYLRIGNAKIDYNAVMGKWSDTKSISGASTVGFIGFPPLPGIHELTFGYYWNNPTLVHELGHLMGMAHKHQRKDRASLLPSPSMSPLTIHLKVTAPLLTAATMSGTSTRPLKSLKPKSPTQHGVTSATTSSPHSGWTLQERISCADFQPEIHVYVMVGFLHGKLQTTGSRTTRRASCTMIVPCLWQVGWIVSLA